MDMNTVLAVLGVIVAAVIVIALSIWLGKSRKRDLDRAMGKVAPDNKKTRDAKAAADPNRPSPTPERRESNTPTATPKIEVIKPIPQTGVESGALWHGVGALLLSATGFIGIRYYKTRKQRS